MSIHSSLPELTISIVAVTCERNFSIPFRMLFGNFLEIRGDKFDDVIESVADETFLVIHIYDEVGPVASKTPTSTKGILLLTPLTLTDSIFVVT